MIIVKRLVSEGQTNLIQWFERDHSKNWLFFEKGILKKCTFSLHKPLPHPHPDQFSQYSQRCLLELQYLLKADPVNFNSWLHISSSFRFLSVSTKNPTVQFQKKSVYQPHRWSLKILRGWGVLKAKIFKGKYKVINRNLKRGGSGIMLKNICGGERDVDIFCNQTICSNIWL